MSERLTTITFDFWCTLLFDGPGSDERYRPRRLQDFATILAAHGVATKRANLDRAYARMTSYLATLWSQYRDVPVEIHVREILKALDAGLADRLPPEALASLIDAYSRPATIVPPTVDTGALTAVETLCARGYTLAVISNTMRTPGVALRKVLERYRLLGAFKHITFSDEVGIRKPAPEIFAMTLRALDADPARSLHVGDDPILDVHGARAAGMRVVQVTDAPPTALGVNAPDAVVRSLIDLPAAIARLDA